MSPGQAADRRQRLLEALIESVFDGVLIVSPAGKMIYHNQLFLDIWNFPPEIIASGSDEAALHWAAHQTTDPERFLSRVATVYSNGRERVREEVAMKDGRVYERCGSVVRTGDGDEPWMWTFRDISPRRQSELALTRSELRYRTLFNSLDEGFCVIRMIFDEDGRPDDYEFVEINPAFVAHTGLEDVIGKRMRELVPDHDQVWFDRYGQVALTGEAVRFEQEAVAMQRRYDVYGFRVDDPELGHVGVLFTDVTQRHQATEALRKSEQFSRAVMDSSPDCIKVLDRKGHLQFMNSGGLELMEIDDFNQFAGQAWCGLWGEEDRSAVEAAMKEAQAGRPARFQAMCATAKGTKKWWDVMIAPIGKDKAADGGLISVSRDITEIKNAEEKLRLAKEAAETASRAKDRFLATLSHELRTPLNPVLLTASALSEDPSLSPALREQLQMIERNVALEARLIDDLLDLTRVSSGKLTMQEESCDLHTLIALVVEMVHADAQEKNLQVHLELGARQHGLSGDPARLQQVIWNLLRNAVKFSPAGRSVYLRTYDAPAESGEERLAIEVADEGMGIEPAALKSIFEPFEQEGRASGSGGLGLGLAIARAIILQHQGTVEAQSDGPGKGATFVINLPASAPPSSQIPVPELSPPSAAAAEPACPPLRLLLVEDHQATLEALAALLRKAGHAIFTAGTLAEARLLAAQHPLDGLISDVGLPDGTGFQLMEELSAAYGLRGIVLSGYGMEDDLRRSREVGFIAHLVKPVRISELRQLLPQLVVRS